MTFVLAFALFVALAMLVSFAIGRAFGSAWEAQRRRPGALHPWATRAPHLVCAVPLLGGLVAAVALLPASPGLWLAGVCACEALGGLHVCPFHLTHAATLVVVLLLAAIAILGPRVRGIARAWQQGKDVEHLALAAGSERDGIVYIDNGGRALVFVAGLRRPRLHVERIWWSRLEPRERAVIAAHERSHIDCRDACVLLVLDIVLTVVAPRVRMSIIADWILATELRADRAAAEHDGDPIFVAEVLCRYARASVPAATLGFGGATLEARVRSLLSGPRCVRPRWNVASKAAFGASLSAACCLGHLSHRLFDAVLNVIAWS